MLCCKIKLKQPYKWFPRLHLTAVSNLFPRNWNWMGLSRRETVAYSISAPSPSWQAISEQCSGHILDRKRRRKEKQRSDETKQWKACLWIKWMVLVGPEQINAGPDAKWPGLLFCSKKWLCHTSKPKLLPLQIFNPKMREQALPYPLQPAFIRIKSTSRIKLWESFSSVGLTLHF